MPKLLCAFTHHHDSERGPWRAFVKDEADALVAALADEFGLELREPAEAVLARAKAAGERGTKAAAVDQGYGDDDPEDDDAVVVWDFVENGERNLGCGRAYASESEDFRDHTDKRENVWLHLEQWEPEPAKVAELTALSKEELVQRLLEVEATR
jgi:hypothetical protein